ncbi:MAG: hypothetical protein QW796_03420 [Thermoproteota archaeon]
MASSNSIHPAVTPSNYMLMVELTKKYGTYPIDEKLIEEYAGRKYISKSLV